MVDFAKLLKPKRVVVPVMDQHFVYHHKPYFIESTDGWFVVEVQSNLAKVIEPWHAGLKLFSTIDDLRYIHGFTYNNEILFKNFDVARRWKFNCTAPLYFNQSQTFESILGVVWEDERVYWFGPNYADVSALELKSAFDNGESLEGKKGITPELRSLFLYHSLERDNLRALAEQVKLKEDHAKMMRDIPSRLQFTFQRAGAELLNYSISGKRIVVDWKIPGGDQKYNSVIDADTWKIQEAGYCMSNDDKRHNITSMVVTAKEYEEKDLTYITRH
jgi:hypothetical protein